MYKLFLLVMMLLPPIIALGRSASPEELATAYFEAHNNGDKEELLSLYYLVNTPPNVIKTTKWIIQTEIDHNIKIKSVRIIDVDMSKLEKSRKGYKYKGKLYVINMSDIKHTLLITYESDGPNNSMKGEIFIGKSKEAYYLANTKPKD